MYGTNATIGYDSATNVVVECIDKIRDTASSHNRLFFIEVMGRDAGFIALRTGIATGAIAIMLPEKKQSIEDLISILDKASKRRKTSNIVIVAEGDELGGAVEIAKKVEEQYSFYETKVTVLGHIQRGGSPSCFDRVLASQLGVAAVEGLLEGESNVMTGSQNGKIVYVPLDEAIKHTTKLNPEILKLTKILTI